MNYSENFAIASFRSRSAVQKFAAALRRRNVACRLISTPREVAIGCGLSVRFEPNAVAAAMQEYRAGGHGALIGFTALRAWAAKRRLRRLRFDGCGEFSRAAGFDLMRRLRAAQRGCRYPFGVSLG
jgi:hypothetical protein